MAEFRPSKTPVRWYVRVPIAAFESVGSDPEEFARFCEVIGREVDVSVSRAGRDCVWRRQPDEQDRYVVCALPFASANEASRRRGGPYRAWATDFALLEGERTEAGIFDWLRRNEIEIDSYDLGTLYVPPNPPRWRS